MTIHGFTEPTVEATCRVCGALYYHPADGKEHTHRLELCEQRQRVNRAVALEDFGEGADY